MWRGYLHIPYPLWSFNHDLVLWVVMVVIHYAISWHLQAMDVYTLCQPYMQSSRPPLPLNMTPKVFTLLLWMFWCISTGRSCDFLLIHPTGVCLGQHWVITRPLSTCGVISSSLPFGSWLNWGGTGTSIPCLVDAHTQGNASLWCDENNLVSVGDAWLSMLVCHFVGGDVCCDLTHHLMHVSSSHLSLIFLFPLEASGFTKTRLACFKSMVPIFRVVVPFLSLGFCHWLGLSLLKGGPQLVIDSCHIFIHMLGGGILLEGDLCAP